MAASCIQASTLALHGEILLAARINYGHSGITLWAGPIDGLAIWVHATSANRFCFFTAFAASIPRWQLTNAAR